MLYICAMINKESLERVIETFKKIGKNPIDLMRNTQFKRSELGLDARVANHWSEKGLFSRDYDNGSWLIFDLTEAFWVRIIMKLREYNVSLETIKEIKESFFDGELHKLPEINKDELIRLLPHSEVLSKEQLNQVIDEILEKHLKSLELSTFEKVILSVIFDRYPYFILLNNSGKALLAAEDNPELNSNKEYRELYNEITSKSHLRISLNEILAELVSTLGEMICSEKIPVLTQNEAEILRLIRTENMSKLELHFSQDSKPIRVDITTENKLIESARLTDIIMSNGYQNISIKTQNGKITHCVNTRKIKLDTE